MSRATIQYFCCFVISLLKQAKIILYLELRPLSLEYMKIVHYTSN